MAEKHRPPSAVLFLSIFVVTVVYALGKLRDTLLYKRPSQRKGYSALQQQFEDFFTRRFFARGQDCFSRPLASAPGGWFDVLTRTKIAGTSGFHSMKLKLTGGVDRCLNFGSYNYLGFAASDPYCTPRVHTSLQAYGCSTCSPRVEGGSSALHTELEETVAAFVGKEAAITYGMGYATNSCSIPVLVGPGCLVLSDALNHASAVAGVRASGATVMVFRHNDMKHLETLLRQAIACGQPKVRRAWRKVVIIVEGIYSMEGEYTPLREVVALKRRYKAYLYLDEAHSIGALGATGKGLCQQLGVDPADVDVLMGTFTKSFGSCGGYIAADRDVIAYLKRHSPAHLYACSMAPAAVQQVTSALHVLTGKDGTDRGANKIRQLHENSDYVRGALLDWGLQVLGDWGSPVMPIMVYHVYVMIGFSRLCLGHRLALVVASFPATPLLESRVRLCISAAHTRADLDYALDVLREVSQHTWLRFGSGKAKAKAKARAELKALPASPAGAVEADGDDGARSAKGLTNGVADVSASRACMLSNGAGDVSTSKAGVLANGGGDVSVSKAGVLSNGGGGGGDFSTSKAGVLSNGGGDVSASKARVLSNEGVAVSASKAGVLSGKRMGRKGDRGTAASVVVSGDVTPVSVTRSKRCSSADAVIANAVQLRV